MAGTKKKPRKAHRPRAVFADPFATFGGMGSRHAAHLQGVQLKSHRALSEFAQGRGTREGWDLLVGAINMANVMCEQGIGDEFRTMTISARDALLEVGKRIVSRGIFALKGDELNAIRTAMEAHDAQLENIRAIDVERAYSEVQRRLRERINSTSVIEELAVA